MKEFLISGFWVDTENKEKIISIVYICNPIVALSQKVTMSFSIKGCGKFEL